MIQTAEIIKNQILTVWIGGEAHKIQDVLIKWGKSIIDETIEYIAPDNKDSEVVQELKDQL